MSLPPKLEERIRELPDQPGIYVFKDTSGRAVYVGKAASLRKRVASYLQQPHEARIAAMLAEANDLEIVVTDTPAEALLLENNWIKGRQPRYNILLRDDKTYPYLKLSMRDEYPRISLTRRVRNDGGEYFGPYLPAGLARKAIKLVQKLFEIRVCRIEIDGSLPRPCLYHDMKRCLGPCVAGLTTQQEYAGAIRAATLFLSGRNDELLRDLRQQMMTTSAAEEFERAAQLRDLIGEVEAVSEKRKLSSVRGEDVDVYGVHVRGGRAAVCVLVMRGGQVLDRRELFWEGEEAVSPERVLSELLPQIYDRTTFIPGEIHLPLPIEGDEALIEWLNAKKRERVYLRLPSRGAKAQRVALAMHNAELAHRRRFRSPQGDHGIEQLQKELSLPETPRRIEAFDVSNLQGQQMVASLVVWEEGRMRKTDYRSFNIRGLEDQDDYAAIRQAVERRYQRRLKELGSMPDLILIDGGRGQLNAALESLTGLGVEETPIAALAKRDEELHLPHRPEPLRLARRDPGLRLLQEIRDEAHRFALSRHQRRRSANTLRTVLEEIPGIGPRRRKALLREFGSLKQTRLASKAELQAVLGQNLGNKVFEYLCSEPDS